MLPDFLIGQKLVENAKVEKFKCDIFEDFQTMCLPNFCWRFRTTLFSTFRDLRAPHFGIFHSVWQGKCRETPPWYFSSFCKSFSFFCYPETLFKAARILPFISCGHIFAFGCLCHFNTLQTLQASSLETSALCVLPRDNCNLNDLFVTAILLLSLNHPTKR